MLNVEKTRPISAAPDLFDHSLSDDELLPRTIPGLRPDVAVETAHEEIHPVQASRRRGYMRTLGEGRLSDAPPAGPFVIGLVAPGRGPHAAVEPDSEHVEMIRAPTDDRDRRAGHELAVRLGDPPPPAPLT